MVKLHFKLENKIATNAILIGMDQGHPVYRNSRSEYFYLDPQTGDLHFLTDKQSQIVIKSAAAVKFKNASVKLVGIDMKGNVVQTNSAGEMFYLDSTTGDMIFVK
jgi:hypothetical protein